MPLEAKATLSNQSLKKSLERLEKCCEQINDWLGADLTEEFKWKVIPAIFFEDKSETFSGKICKLCLPYVIHGTDIYEDLKNMLDLIPEGPNNNHEMAKEEFIKTACYLMFLVSFEPIITPSSVQVSHENKKSDESTEVRRRPTMSM